MLAIVLKLFEVITNAGAALGFFLGMILLRRKSKNKSTNKILAALLMALSASILHSILVTSVFQGSFSIREPFILFIGPLLYFYVIELIGIRKMGHKDILHFLPFAATIIFFISVFFNFIPKYSQFVIKNELVFSRVIWLLIVFQFGYYWFYIVSLLRKHRKMVELEFSNLEGKTLSWLYFFLHIFGVFLLLLVLTVFIAFHTNYYNTIDMIVSFGLTMAIFALGHNGLFQEVVFSSQALISDLNKSEELNKPGTIRTNEPLADKNNELFQKLIKYIDAAKPYLDESLTLTELANNVGMTRNQLSALINNSTGENFYTFINKYRVEQVKRLIADPAKMNFTILSLAYESGFSSKSAFQSAFKKLTGLTPTEYREKLK